tara:strand:- start:1091 stop:1309 length:219 start_codon:yes stop_codon:yes gene_type:complete
MVTILYRPFITNNITTDLAKYKNSSYIKDASSLKSVKQKITVSSKPAFDSKIDITKRISSDFETILSKIGFT